MKLNELAKNHLEQLKAAKAQAKANIEAVQQKEVELKNQVVAIEQEIARWADALDE